MDVPLPSLEDDDFIYSDPIKEFEEILKTFIVEPFGEKLN